MSAALLVTFGFGLTNDIGRTVEIDNSNPVLALMRELEAITPETREAWLVLAAFEGGDREDDRWLAGSGIYVDADYHDAEGRRAALPDGFFDRVVVAAVDTGLHGNLLHPTLRGIRIFSLFTEPITDKAEWKRAAASFHALVENDLRQAGLIGPRGALHLDGHGKAPNGFAWCPNTTDHRGTRREAKIHLLTERPYEAATLAASAPPGPEKQRFRYAGPPPDLGRLDPYVRKAVREEAERVAAARADRNVTLNASAFRIGTLLGAFGQEGAARLPEVEEAFFQAACANGDVDDDGEHKSRDTIARALSRGMENPRVVPGTEWKPPIPFGEDLEPPPFPLGALDPESRAYVEAVADHSETDPSLAAVLYLAVAGFAVSKKVVVETNRGHVETPNTFALIVQPPSTRKTAVFAEVLGPIREREAELSVEMREPIARYRADLAIAKKLLEKAQKECADPKPGADRIELRKRVVELQRELDRLERNPVVEPQWIGSDATMEAIGSLLFENQGRIMLASSEAKLFSILAGLYQDRKQGPDFDILLHAYSGVEDIVVNRKGRPREHVPKPSATMAVTLQPGRLRSFRETPALEEFGLLSRIFTVVPKSNVGWRTHDRPEIPDGIRAAAHRRIHALLSIPFPGLPDPCGEKRFPDPPTTITLTTGAKEALHAFKLEVEAKLRPYLEYHAIANWAGKLPGGAARVALQLHMLAHAGADSWREPIIEETMQSAIEVGRFLAAHTKAAYREIQIDDAETLALRIVDWLGNTKRTTLTKRDVHTKVMGGHKDEGGNLDRALDLLLELRYAREDQPDAEAKRDHRRRAFTVSPWIVPVEDQAAPERGAA